MQFSALLVIGPTASGKTAFAHSISDLLAAQGILSELVNLDAFQFYKGVSAGTAKPSPEEISRYSYHCVDFLEPDESFDAQAFASQASVACRNIFAQGKVPICVGGSGLYLRAFLHGLDTLPARDDAIRSFLRDSSARWGWKHLHDWLAVVDPVRAAELHSNDGVRIERALEIFFLTGKRPSDLRTKTSTLAQQDSLFNSFVVHVDASDKILRDRIDSRVPTLLAQGWVREVMLLKQRYGDSLADFQCMKAIGYKEIMNFICGDAGQSLTSERELIDRISTQTWQYARRQRTWNAKEKCDGVFSFDNGGAPQILLSSILDWWRTSVPSCSS